MRHYLKLLLVASIALPVSVAHAQDSSTSTGLLKLPPLKRKIEVNQLSVFDEEDNLIHTEMIGVDDPLMNEELPEGVYIDQYRYSDSELRENFSGDGHNLNDLNGDGQIQQFELDSYNRYSASDADVNPNQSGVIELEGEGWKENPYNENGIVEWQREQDLGLHEISSTNAGEAPAFGDFERRNMFGDIPAPNTVESVPSTLSPEELNTTRTFAETGALPGLEYYESVDMPEFNPFPNSEEPISHMPMFDGNGDANYGLGHDINPHNRQPNRFINPDGTLRPLPRVGSGEANTGPSNISNITDAVRSSGIPVPGTVESITGGYVEHTYDTSNYGVLSTSHNNPEGFANLENYLNDIGSNYSAFDLVDRPLPDFLDPRSVFGDVPGTAESITGGIQIPGVDSRSARSVAGTELLGNAFEVLPNGTALFETSGAPVAVNSNGVVQALDSNNRIRPDVVLGQITSAGTIDPNGAVNNIAGNIVGSVGSDGLSMLGLGLDAINGDGSFLGINTGTLGQGNFNAGALTSGLANQAVGSTVNNVLNRFLGLGGGSNGGGYTIGNDGLGNGFSLAIGPQRVQANHANFLSNIGTGGGGGFGGFGGLGGLLADATNGDGTFMGQQTGSLGQGNLNFSNFNVGSALGLNSGASASTSASASTASTSAGSITRPVAIPPQQEYTIPNTGPR